MLIPHLMRFLQSDNFVVHTYAAACIERLMSVKDEKGVPRYASQARLPAVESFRLMSCF